MITNGHITLGAKIRALRGLCYISQARLAEMVGSDQRTISLFERDLAMPSDEIREAMEKTFGIQFDSFHIIFTPIDQPEPINLAARFLAGIDQSSR